MTNDNFFVQLPSYANDNNGFYKRAILDTVEKKYPWLTVAGVSDPYYTNKGNRIDGVQSAGPGNLLTFGTAKYHDVNWVRRATYATERGYHPILNPVTNWNTVMDKLHTFAMNRRPSYSYRYSEDAYALGNDRYVIGGTNVTITDDFVFVGTKALPRRLTEKTYFALPTTTRAKLVGIALILEKL